ncbi:MAG: AAA family ATPase [Propionibacteriaceae bacterium]|nr:AAA family ATPase [Propionibacteriaceae bacterium]
MNTPMPTWLREVDVALSSFPHIVLTGDTTDLHLLPEGQLETRDALGVILTAAGLPNIATFDPVAGLTALSGDIQPLQRRVGQLLGSPCAPQPPGGDIDSASGQLRAALNAVMHPSPPYALLISGAARLAPGGNVHDTNLHSVMVMAEAQAVTVSPQVVEGSHRAPIYPPVIWLLDQPNDLPAWFVRRPEVRTISVPRATAEQLERYASFLLPHLPTADGLTPQQQAEVAQRFADAAGGLSLRSVPQVIRVAMDQNIPLSSIEDAVRLFRVGIPDNPWHASGLRDRIRWAAGDAPDPTGSREPLGHQVLGQQAAIRKTLDVLIRSTTGLTGAQVRRRGTRPQGVLFFAGPTGVGKTELAKALAALVFGEGDTFVRFDMSEFSSEASEARLIGSPPGYIGSDAGGELTNAIQQRPFTVVLFDEIEKAHPRILDKFLQILEDGRLTSGTGSTVHFGETLIIFTSNLGVYRRDPGTDQMECLVPREPRLEYREFERRIVDSVRQHFTTQLGRPEILNRIGENNIVVFEYISDEVSDLLVDKFIGNVVDNVAHQTGVRLEVSDTVRQVLKGHARRGLDFGGRGVSTAIETMFVNPLGRHLIALPPGTARLNVTAIAQAEDGHWELTASC